MIKRIHHMPVYVGDFEGNLKIFTDVMKFPIVGTPVDENVHIRFLKVGSDLIELMDANQFDRPCQTALLVDDLNKEIETLKKKGMNLGEIEEFKMKEGKLNFIFFKKFDEGWMELVERVNWNP